MSDDSFNQNATDTAYTEALTAVHMKAVGKLERGMATACKRRRMGVDTKASLSWAGIHACICTYNIICIYVIYIYIVYIIYLLHYM
jgi:hypothetical protein